MGGQIKQVCAYLYPLVFQMSADPLGHMSCVGGWVSPDTQPPSQVLNQSQSRARPRAHLAQKLQVSRDRCVDEYTTMLLLFVIIDSTMVNTM